jgi:hypothetical protein
MIRRRRAPAARRSPARIRHNADLLSFTKMAFVVWVVSVAITTLTTHTTHCWARTWPSFPDRNDPS